MSELAALRAALEAEKTKNELRELREAVAAEKRKAADVVGGGVDASMSFR